MSGGIVQRTVDGDEIGFLQNGIEIFEINPLRSLLKIRIESHHPHAKSGDSFCHLQPDLSTSDKTQSLSLGPMDGDTLVKIPVAGFHLSIKKGGFSD